MTKSKQSTNAPRRSERQAVAQQARSLQSRKTIVPPRFPPEVFENIVSHLEFSHAPRVCDDDDRRLWWLRERKKRRALLDLSQTCKALQAIVRPILFRHLCPIARRTYISNDVSTNSTQALLDLQQEASDSSIWQHVRSVFIGDIWQAENIIASSCPRNLLESLNCINLSKLTSLTLQYIRRPPDSDERLARLADVLRNTPSLEQLHIVAASNFNYQRELDGSVAIALSNLKQLRSLEMYLEIGGVWAHDIPQIVPASSKLQRLSITGDGSCSRVVNAFVHSLLPDTDMTVTTGCHVSELAVYRAWPLAVRTAVTVIDFDAGHLNNRDISQHIAYELFPRLQRLIVRPVIDWFEDGRYGRRSLNPVGRLPSNVLELEVMNVRGEDAFWSCKWTLAMTERSDTLLHVTYSALALRNRIMHAEHDYDEATQLRVIITDEFVDVLRNLQSMSSRCQVTIRPPDLEELLVGFLKKRVLRRRKSVVYS